MFAEKHYPDSLLPEDLDDYLARGWYRMGQSVFTTHFLCFEENFYSAIWIRLNLQQHDFNKHARKLMRRNGQRFRMECARAKITSEKEELYQRYKKNFPGLLAPSLLFSLNDGEEKNIYRTYSINIYDADRLVATSFFDVGRHSAASIMGIYDPDYSRYSLGFYSMLGEMIFCRQNHIQFYYPGYIVPGYPRFDYKTRIGNVDYFNLHSRSWLPLSSLTPAHIPLIRMEQKLHELQQAMQKKGIPARLLHYPLFEANLFAFWQTNYFDFPVFLHCYPHESTDFFITVVFDVRDESYHLLQCSPLDDLMFYVNDAYTSMFDRERFFLELMVIKSHLLRTNNPEYLQVALSGLMLSKRLK